MYAKRDIPESFSTHVEALCLTSSILFSKIRSGEITEDIALLTCSHVLVRVYQKLFPVFEVYDGYIPRFGQNTNNHDYGEKGYFHYHEGRSRPALSGQLKLQAHSLLMFKERVVDQSLPRLVIDVLPLGHVNYWPFASPLCLDENGPAFIKQTLSPSVEKDFVRKARHLLPILEEVKMEVDALL